MKNYLRQNKAITLIALVISIIVILILAGVAIASLTGNNGLLQRTADSKEKNEYAELEEEAKLVLLSRRTYINGNSQTLKDALEQQISGEKEVTEVDGKTDTCYVKRGNATITVYDDGEVSRGEISVWDGNTIKCPELKQENNVWNWYIYTPAQLKFLADFVNNGNSVTGTVDLTNFVTEAHYNIEDVVIEEDKTTVYLMNDIDLGGVAQTSYTGEKNWETTRNESYNWTPIGTQDNPFMGIFDGKENTINRMYINKTDGTPWLGLFGNAKNVQNLSVKNSYIKGLGTMGAVVASLMGNGKIINCHNINTTITAERNYNGNTAGIVASAGNSSEISGCTNSGTITGFRQIAGIAGWSGGTVYNCSNTGKITAQMYYGAGIVSYASGLVENCTNSGVITGEMYKIGGIVGTSESITRNCNNSGAINGGDGTNGYTGGIVGSLSNDGEIDNCSNIGTISVKGNYASGICGGLNQRCTVRECCNMGMVNGNGKYTAGIVGGMNTNGGISNSVVEKCYNSGQIDGGIYVGGIVGRLAGTSGEGQGTITECYNKGKITGQSNVAQIMGDEGNKNGLNIVNKIFYLENVNDLIAICGEEDNETKQIMEVTDDFSYEQFKIWITQQ